jgi:hypothetical protein
MFHKIMLHAAVRFYLKGLRAFTFAKFNKIKAHRPIFNLRKDTLLKRFGKYKKLKSYNRGPPFKRGMGFLGKKKNQYTKQFLGRLKKKK